MSYKLLFFIFILFLFLLQIAEVEAQTKKRRTTGQSFSKAIYAQELGIDTSLTFDLKDLIGLEFKNSGGFVSSTLKFKNLNGELEYYIKHCTGDTTLIGSFEILRGNTLKTVVETSTFKQKIESTYDIIQFKNFICLISPLDRKKFVKEVKELEKNKDKLKTYPFAKYNDDQLIVNF
jgi:hypothetical protein